MKSAFFKTSDCVRLHYLEAGQGPSLLLVPGFTAPADIWLPQLTSFSTRHRVVALDPRSHGKSDRPSEGHYPARMARDIREAIEALDLAPVTVVAWAFACSQLLVFVRDHGTSLLNGLVLVDGFVGRDMALEDVMWYLRWTHAMQENREKHARAFVRSWYVQPHDDAYLDRITRASMRCPTNSAVTLVSSWQTLENLSNVLGQVDVPLMYIGIEEKQDQIAVVEQHAPGAETAVVAAAGHALFVDQPQQFERIVTDFIARRVAPRDGR